MNPPPEGNDDGSLQARFQNVLRGLVLYVQARHRLFLIETREASGFLSKRIALAVVALVFLVFGYVLFLAGAVIVVDRLTGVPWYFVCLLLAPVHLLLGYVFLSFARRPPAEPLFRESVNELAKDREWLSNSKKPWT